MSETGLFDSVKQFGATLTGVVATRLALLANELHEERLRLTQMLFLALLAFFFFGLALVMGTTFLVVLFWESHRLWVLGALGVSFTLAGSGLIFLLLDHLRQKPKLFAASLAELHKDRASLQ